MQAKPENESKRNAERKICILDYIRHNFTLDWILSPQLNLFYFLLLQFSILSHRSIGENFIVFLAPL